VPALVCAASLKFDLERVYKDAQARKSAGQGNSGRKLLRQQQAQPREESKAADNALHPVRESGTQPARSLLQSSTSGTCLDPVGKSISFIMLCTNAELKRIIQIRFNQI